MAEGVQHKLDVAAKAASYNMLLQILLRVGTFVVNGFVLRYIHAELLGVVNMRLTLLYNTVLFLSREALRKACLSRTSEDIKWRHVNNLMCCSPLLGLVTSCLVSLLWLSPLLKQPNVPYDVIGVALFSASAISELVAEPLWVMGQKHHYVRLKVMAEGVPQVVRCLVVVVGMCLAPQGGVVLFSVAQLLYSLLYLLIYYGYFYSQLGTPEGKPLPIGYITDIIPHIEGGTKTWCSPYLLRLSWSFFKHSFLKQLLTDGERYVMTIFGVLSFAQQGVYDVINNLGSLVARFIFLPIEENFYVFFASVLYRGEPALKQKEGVLPGVAHTLAMILKLVLMVAMVMLSFGYSYSYLALNIYGGRLLSNGEGPTLLRWYCVYVFTLGLNGVTECFVHAAMSQREVDRYNGTMLVFSAVFLCASLLLTKTFGSVGFILANCINMAARIVHSCYFIQTFFSPTPLRPLLVALPSLPMVMTFVLSFLITAFSEWVLCCDRGLLGVCLHVMVGGACLLGVVTMVMLSEQELTSFVLSRLPHRVSSHVLHVIKTLHIPTASPKAD